MARPQHTPSRAWIRGGTMSGIPFMSDGAVPRWRHWCDVALCWLHDNLASPPVRWSQQVEEKRDWKRWCVAAEDGNGLAPPATAAVEPPAPASETRTSKEEERDDD